MTFDRKALRKTTLFTQRVAKAHSDNEDVVVEMG